DGRLDRQQPNDIPRCRFKFTSSFEILFHQKLSGDFASYVCLRWVPCLQRKTVPIVLLIVNPDRKMVSFAKLVFESARHKVANHLRGGGFPWCHRARG